MRHLPDEPAVRWGAAVPVAVFVATALFTVGVDVVNARSDAPTGGIEPGWPSLLAGLPQAVLGVLLLRTRPRHAVAWLLLASGLAWLLDAACGAWLRYAAYTHPGLPGATTAAWVLQRFGALLLPLMAALVIVFPDGRLPRSRPWRLLAATALGLGLVYPVIGLVAPAAVMNRLAGTDMPVGGPVTSELFTISLPWPVWQAMAAVGRPAMIGCLLVPFAITVHRYRRADAEGRAQIRWLMWAVLIALVLPLALSSGPQPIGFIVLTASFALVAVAIAVAITRHRLYDIDRLLPATLVYGTLAGTFVLLDAAVVALAGTWIGERDAALAATALVATAYVVGRDWLWRWARRLLLGRPADTSTVATLAHRLEVAADLEQQFTELVRILARAFRLGYVSVQVDRLDGTELTVTHGTRGDAVLSLPIAYRTEPVGRLVLDRRDRSQLTQDDQRLLGDLVRQAAAAARATDINAALRRARTGLVLAREDERRRLRRDLHDGLGPSLGAIALRIETARNLAGAAPDAADRMLDGAARDIGAVLDEVRRVVYDLRPPALDELGLVRAVRQQADRLAGATRSIQVHAVEPLPALPAAVEVAAYRIVSEALTNVVRHADATRCTVTLIPDPGDVALVVEIRDDGRGWEPDTAAGVGLISMRERAAELGGWCDIIRPENGGTAVRCRLPFTGNQPAEWFNDDVTTEAHV